MLRGRKAGHPSGGTVPSQNQPSRRVAASSRTPASASGGSGMNRSQRQRSRAIDIGMVVLLSLAAVLTVATWLFPNVRQIEEEQWNQMMMRGGGQRQPPVKPDVDHGDSSLQGIQADEMGTKWVDGEKKLKRRLEKLAQRQAMGNDIGVPVLTRWLGDEIPAWPTDPKNPMEESVWRKRVEEKYEQMRKEEMEWRMQMTHYLEGERG